MSGCRCRKGRRPDSPEPTSVFPLSMRDATAFRDPYSNHPPTQDVTAASGVVPILEAPMYYPMFLMSWEVVMGLDHMVAHQLLKRDGQLTVWFEELLGRVLLVSHEWLGYSHPDPADEQLRELQGTLQRLASGLVAVHSDWKQKLYGKATKRLRGKRLAAVLPICYFWLDYAGVPQAIGDEMAHATADHRFSTDEGSTLAKHMMDAVRSIPAYIERSAALLVLTPTCQHRDVPDRVCGFSSWRGRGWCRVELCAALLSRTRVRLMRCLSKSAVPEFMTGGEALFLPPGLGAYTCCARDHNIDGFTIECDKVRLSAVMARMLEAAAEHLHEVGEPFQRRVLLCSKDRFLRGLSPTPDMVACPSERTTVEDFEACLRWGEEDAEEALKGTAPSLLHWAALAGNAPVIAALMANGHKGVNSPMPNAAPEFGLTVHLAPLHLAAFSANGQAAAMQALLDAGADATLQDSGRSGRCAPMFAVAFGTLDQVRAWFARFPAWDLERRDRALGLTLLAHAAFVGPTKAPFLAFLIAQKADVRAGGYNTAFKDAALLLACLKDDSDPDLVKMLLAAGCSPTAVWSPPSPKWRVIYGVMRLAARVAVIRRRPARPLVAVMANAVGSTPLHLAAWNGDATAMRLLLQAKADPSLRNAMGRTALDLARLRFGGRAPYLIEAILPVGNGAGWKRTGEDEVN